MPLIAGTMMLQALPGSGLIDSRQTRTEVLENGLIVLVQEDKSVPLTALHLLLRAGGQDQPGLPPGLPFLTARLSTEINDDKSLQNLLARATRINVRPGDDFNHIRLLSLGKHFESSLATMVELVKKPVFSNLRIGYLLDQFKYQEDSSADDFGHLAFRAHLAALFPESIYAYSLLGTPESRKKIRPRLVAEYHEELFRGGNIILALVSDLPAKEILALAEKHFSSLPAGRFAARAKPVPVREPGKEVLYRGHEHAYISFAFPLPLSTLNDYALGLTLEALLGGGPGSLLWPLRQEEGLAYDVQARFSPLAGAGLLVVFLQTESRRRDEALTGINEILSVVSEGTSSPEETAAARVNARANWLRKNEERAEKAANMALLAALELTGPDTRPLEKEIEALKDRQILAFIREHLVLRQSSRVIIVPAGEHDHSGEKASARSLR